MDKGLIPRRYAKALYEVAVERHDDARIYGIMQALTHAFNDTEELCRTMANPYVSDADKIEILMTSAGDALEKDDKTFADFLKLLSQNKRLDLARDIALAYIYLYRHANDIYKVTVVSAAPIGKAEKARLESVIAKHIGKGSIEYDYSVDSALIGGFTVTVNSERLDASVAAKLKDLKLSMSR